MAQYVITDGDRFIYRNHQNKFVPTKGQAMADIYTKEQADKILSNSIPKALRTVFKVQRIDKNIPNTKPVSNSDIKSTEKLELSEQIKDWVKRLSDLNGLATDASKRKNELAYELSNIDKELTDVYHYIEFTNLNAAQGYKAYKMIKERRIKRRTIKNELEVLNIILGKKISETLTEEIKSSVAGLDKRTYEPRVLKELFDI